MFLIESNIKNPIVIRDYSFSEIKNAYLDLNAGDKKDRDLPSKVKIEDSTFEKITTVYHSFIRVSENSELELDASNFTKCQSEG